MALHPLSWGRLRRDAGHYLVSMSLLCEHDHFLRNFEPAEPGPYPDFLDVEAMENFGWSSGEKTLVNLFLVFAGFGREVTINDILSLDSRNKSASGNAIAMACAKEGSWFPSAKSYQEAF